MVAAGLATLWHRRGRRACLVCLGDAPGDLDVLSGAKEGPSVISLGTTDRLAARDRDWNLLERLVCELPWDYLILDCSPPDPASLKHAARWSDLMLVVATPDLLGMRSLIRGRDRVLAQGLGGHRVGLLLNRSGIPSGIPLSEAMEVAGGDFWGVLPDAPSEVTTLVKGEGLSPGGVWTKALEACALHLDGVLSTLPPLPLARVEDLASSTPAQQVARQEIMRKLVRRLGEFDRRADPSVLRRKVTEAAAEVMGEFAASKGLTRRDSDAIAAQLVDEVLGLGVIEELVRDPEVTEVMINGPRRVYVERAGRIQRVGCRFDSPEDITRLVDRVISPLGRRIDESSPMVDARLPDGSRLNAVIPPLALDGPLVTIRRFGVTSITMDDLVRNGTLAESLAQLLREAVVARKNILLSGGTGTGKTTLLNALSGFIPATERIITIEDAAELRLQQEHVVRLEARPANIEGQGAVTIRDLVRNALRMRPDRIIVGEVRGPEALDMLQAMNTGHNGSLATIHANSAKDALSRLETMALMANVSLPLRVVREQVGAAVDLVVHLERLPDGRRQVTEALALTGLAGGRYLCSPHRPGRVAEEQS